MTAQTLNQAGAKARVSRRAVVRGAGVAGAGALVAMRTPVASLFHGDAQAAAACATLTPVKTIGPYFVEEKLNRSDIRVDPSDGSTDKSDFGFYDYRGKFVVEPGDIDVFAGDSSKAALTQSFTVNA